MDDSRFVFLFGRIRKSLRQTFEQQLADLEITVPQFTVLHRLWKGDGILTSVLVNEIASDGGTITGLLDRLEARGLVRRERSTEDRRAIAVYLTPAGRNLEKPLMKILSSVNEQALEGLSSEERAKLNCLLMRIGENLGTQPE